MPGDMVVTAAGWSGIFLKFRSYIYGGSLSLTHDPHRVPDTWNNSNHWSSTVGHIDLTRPIAGKYFVWRTDTEKVETCVTGDLMAEVRVLSSYEEKDDDNVP